MDRLNGNRVFKKGDPEPSLAKGKGRIYNMRFCPFAERIELYAAAKGIDVEIVNIDLTNPPDWYFDKHPQGKVPAFEKDGQTVIESTIIPEYLDGIYPSSAILPIDPYLRAKQRILFEQMSALNSMLMFLAYCTFARTETAAKEAKVKALEEALDGSSAGFVDWMLFPLFERIELFSSARCLSIPFPSPRWPSLSRWWHRISVHPAAIAVKQPGDNLLAFTMSFGTGEPDFDIGLSGKDPHSSI